MNNIYGWENQQESPQLMQGLLGSAGDTSNTLDELIASGENKAAQLRQFAQTFNPAAGNGLLAQRQGSAQQSAQSAMAQQQQQSAQSMQMAFALAKMFGV